MLDAHPELAEEPVMVEDEAGIVTAQVISTSIDSGPWIILETSEA